VSPFYFFIVLCAAVFNASWNAIVKSGPDKQLDVTLVAGGAAVFAALALPLLAQPASTSWPYIIASTPVQLLYYRLLAIAYGRGEMSEAYPLMRGIAPLLVATAAGPLIGEQLTLHRWIGVVLICAGTFCMTIDAHVGKSPHQRSAIPIAVAIASVIALYTVIDGLGVRRSGAPLAYVLWIFLLTGLPLALWMVALRGRDLLEYARTRLPLGLLGGAGTVGSYSLTLFAMTAVPVALVAALRETSILFATLIAVVILKERIRWPRYLAISLIACGAIAIRIA